MHQDAQFFNGDAGDKTPRMNYLPLGTRLSLYSVIGSCGMLFSSHLAAGLVIDDFTRGPLAPLQGTNTAQFGTTVVQTGLDPTHTFGGTRSVFVGSLSLAMVSTDSIKGRFHFNANSNYGYFKLDWGSVAPLNVNLADENNQFRIEFTDTTPNVSFSLFDLRVKSGGMWFSYDIANDFTQALHGNTFGTLSIPFSKFGSADFSQVQAIELGAARVPQGFHLVIDSFTIVPEPTVASLLVLAPVLFKFTQRSHPPNSPEPS